VIVSPGFRAVVIGVVVLTAIAIFALTQNSNKQTEVRQQQQARQELWATTAISPQELALTDVSLTKDEFQSWQLKGTVTNNSKITLGSISFLVTIKDCPRTDDCKIIGQENTSTMSEDFGRKPLVPAGQVRLFRTYGMKFANMPPAGNPRWEYEVIRIRAAE